MYTVKNGKVYVMVQDTKKPEYGSYKWVYIPECKWLRMTDQQKKRYIV